MNKSKSKHLLTNS